MLFVKRVTCHKRTAATHLLVFMISSEERKKKPYTLPVHCLPYKGLSDAKVRELANQIIREMTHLNMKVAGFSTNGEWNSLRTKGNTRPLSVLQIRSDVNSRYSRNKKQDLIGMVTPVCLADGSVVAATPNPAVSTELLLEIMDWQCEGATVNDVCARLRQRTVPPGYSFHTRIPDKTETLTEMLRAFLAQREFTYLVNEWHRKGVPFKDHLYVPEVHPHTGLPFCEREDEGHVFKRIGDSLRRGGPKELRLEYFEEAVHDTTSSFTVSALRGVRKQSVEDVERLISYDMVQWMEKKDYVCEAEYLRSVRGWRRACDERGLSTDQRSQLNKAFLDYILDELMPWHRDPGLRDFSLLEITRDVSNIRGFSRETLNALIANIESREWRQHYCISNGIPPEHPRSSTTDDVECFFSVLRDSVGKHFTLREALFGWRKVTVEFLKRLDPDLPFYYYTSAHSRFYEGNLPDFSVSTSHPRQPRRPPQRELLGANQRISFAVRGAGSIRATFHNVPVDLPPPPASETQALSEHSYYAH